MPRAADPTPESPIRRSVLLDARLRQAAGLHVHNGPVVGSILEGSAVYQVEGQPASVLRAGDVFFEPEGEQDAQIAVPG